MKAYEIMTPSPACCSAKDSAKDVAKLMRDNDCGSLPVVDETGCTIGIVTDRDLAVRGLATGKGGDAKVGELMTSTLQTCLPSANLRDVERIMAVNKVRRVPVVDASGKCVGIISQADLARAASDGDRVSEQEVAIVVERISEPDTKARTSGPRQTKDLEARL